MGRGGAESVPEELDGGDGQYAAGAAGADVFSHAAFQKGFKNHVYGKGDEGDIGPLEPQAGQPDQYPDGRRDAAGEDHGQYRRNVKL